MKKFYKINFEKMIDHYGAKSLYDLSKKLEMHHQILKSIKFEGASMDHIKKYRIERFVLDKEDFMTDLETEIIQYKSIFEAIK